MANYPSYAIALSSSVEPESEYEDDFSQPGIQHSRQMRSQAYYGFSLAHNLSLAEFNTLCDFYDANPRDEITFTYLNESPQQTYTVKFTARPMIRTNLGKDKFVVISKLRGTKD